MPGRKYSGGVEYKYGFNGKELDKEVAGTTTYDYGFRIYSPALGKFLSVDPMTRNFSMLTPYQFASNRPIDGIDLDGLEYLHFGEAIYKFVGGISGNYVFNANDVFITDINAHNVLIGIPNQSIFETNDLTDPFDKSGKADWENTNIPKSKKSAMFSEWYKEMRNYNRLPYKATMPMSDAASSKGIAILNAVFEVGNIIQGIKYTNYLEEHSAELGILRDAAAAYDNATRMVGKLVEMQRLPELLLNSQGALSDLVNFMIDGTTSDSDINSGYNEMIGAWGKAIMGDVSGVQNGDFNAPSKLTTYSGGSTDPSSDNTRINIMVAVPKAPNPDLEKAKKITETMNPSTLPKTVITQGKN